MQTNFEYYYGNEADQYSFYRIPKVLFTDERFKSVSAEAKVLYGLMLDRMGLSLKNGWLDGENRVFIYFTLEDVKENLNCGHDKGVKLMAELDTIKGIGLIERVKQGLGKPCKIYVKNCISKADLWTSEKPTLIRLRVIRLSLVILIYLSIPPIRSRNLWIIGWMR